ncbi:integral membrane protein [Aspergillus sp. HF37]|nr:integral membrane protein [Aspergillus sp. HF37]
MASQFISFTLRILQVASAGVTAGTIGYYLSEFFRTFGKAEAIYTMVIAGLSCLVGMVGPFAGYITWPVDIIISLAWFASFGALFKALDNFDCDGSYVDIFYGPANDCKRWVAGESFAFIGGFCFLCTGILGIIFMLRSRRVTAAKERQGGKSAA